MAVIVFLLGRPGSGKSQIARCIKGAEPAIAVGEGEKCLLVGWKVVHITDYKHLLLMFREEEEQSLDPEERCFESSEYGGFNVTNLGFSRAVLEKALEQVNAEILQEIESEQEQKLILVEFARSDYRSINKVFDTKILENAFVFYLQTDLEICVGRVHQRVRSPQWEDDSFVSHKIMTGYYQKEDLAGLLEIFGEKRIKLINNNGEWADTWIEVEIALTEIFSASKEDQAQQIGHLVSQPDETEKQLESLADPPIASSSAEQLVETPAA